MAGLFVRMGYCLFTPRIAGAYFDWPAVIDVFPWQHSGVSAEENLAYWRELVRCLTTTGGAALLTFVREAHVAHAI